MATYTFDKIDYGGNTYVVSDSGALQLTGGQVTGPVTFGDSVSIDEATLGDLVVNGSASFTNNIQANTINGVTVGSSPKFTDTDTKVTSSANHYTPATASGNDKTASASGATAAWSIDVVKGITINTDGKGHITGLSVTSGKIPANPNSDTWRKVQLDGTDKLGTATSTNPLNLKAGTNVSITESSGTFTFSATDTDTKVTSSANHYTPSTASGNDKTASASGATAAWSIDVVKGITINTDGKGHITGLSVTSGKIPANPNTDVKVKQLAAITTAGAYPIILAYSTATTEETNSVNKTSTLTYNPNTKALVTGGTVDGYTLAAASAKSVVTSIDTSASLPTSNAVKTFVENKGYTTNTGTVTKVTAGTGLSIGSTAGGNFTTTGTINHTNSVTAQTTQAVYPIKIDAQGHISAYGSAVTIPSAYELPTASSSTLGGVKVGYTTSGNNRAVQIDSNGNLYVTQKDDNSDEKIKLTSQATSGTYPLIFGPTSITSNSTYQGYYNTGITVNPSTKTVTATTFVGALTGTASGNLTSSSTLDATKLSGTIPTGCYTNTKNTAGTTNKTGTKMFLVGATEQSANPTTYSNSNCYIGTDNCLYSGGTKVLTAHQTAVTSLTTTAGTHVTKTSATGAVSMTIPTKTSHLTNDSGFISTAAQIIRW